MMRGLVRVLIFMVMASLTAICAIYMAVPAEAQLIKKAGELVQNVWEGTKQDTAASAQHTGAPLQVGASSAQQAVSAHNALSDSLALVELERELQEMRLNEIMLREELEKALSAHRHTDSLKLAAQRARIDSLRSVTQGVPVVVEDDTLFTIYAPRGGYSPADRADMIVETMLKIGKNRRITRDSVYMLVNENFIDIMYGDRVITSVTEQDALWYGTTKQKLAEHYAPILSARIKYMKNQYSFWQVVKRAGVFVLVIFFQYLLFRLINYLFRRLKRRIVKVGPQKLRPFIVHDYELLNTRRLCRMLISVVNLVRILVLLTLLIFTVPILFSIFPQTENLALRIFSYIVDPVRMVVKGIVEYIPNLFIIVVIWYCIHYIIKGLRYIAGEIQNEKLRITGFYPDWAEPTFNIIRFLLYAFMIAMIYPYLPGSESGVFQGISVFVGLIVSLGSSTVIANFIAGFVITYMRPFKTGDFIKVKDTMGTVIEKTPFVTRLRTIKNEVITIPNSFIMTSDTVNYSASARRYGLIIHTMLTMGYETPWREVHRLLIEAAMSTQGVLHHPRPFVLETELNDNYMCYQINAYIDDADEMPRITSALHENIQDYFHEAGIELVAPHYFATRDGSDSKIPKDFRRHRES